MDPHWRWRPAAAIVFCSRASASTTPRIRPAASHHVRHADRRHAFGARRPHGNLDPKSSEADARAGAAQLEKKLHLFRNMEHLHWVLTVPSVKDPATGGWKGGDLEAAGDGRGLGIAGNCIFVGHGNGAGKKHAINIFKSSRIRRSSRPCRSARFPPCSKATRDSTIANFARWSTRTRAARTATSWCGTAGTNTAAGWRPTAST